MQDKETADDAGEVLTSKTEVASDSPPPLPQSRKEDKHDKKESSKEGKFAFRKMKTPKKEKPDKNSPSKYEGEGMIFKAKLIGLEPCADARGDKMCQEAMQRLKLNVKNTGPHKRKINICVSLQGIKIKDEKAGAVIYHHPVSLISFISQDITDARAFGYVFGSTSEPHQFIAIKSEKPAFHIVMALRDLFQTVLDYKQVEIENVKDKTRDEKEIPPETKELKVVENANPLHNAADDVKPKDENIYFEVLLTEPLKMNDKKETEKEPVKTVDDLLGLQSEMNKLQEGIHQMETSIAAAAAFNSEIIVPENDPFDTSFVLGPKRDSIPFPMPTPIPVAVPANESQQQIDLSGTGDKYAVFNIIDTSPSIFEAPPEVGDQTATDAREDESEKKTAPSKPPRLSKSPDQSIFADLDPLGKDRPYKDKTEFFQDVKNPPKKVLNDLVDPSREGSKSFDLGLMSPSVPFPVDFESMSASPHVVNSLPSANTPNSILINLKPRAHTLNGEKVFNPFENQNGDDGYSNKLEPKCPIITAGVSTLPHQPASLGKSPSHGIILPPPPSHQQLTVNCNIANLNTSQFGMPQNSSSPIPIPGKDMGLIKDRSFSNCSIGSPYSKSPQFYSSESPNNSDYYISNYSEGNSPTGLKNHTQQSYYMNGENTYAGSPNNNSNNLTKHNINSFLQTSTNNANTQNGVSRPRPRASSGKVGSIPSGGRAISSHSLSSDSSSDYEAISRENMQSIANVLLTNGHRLRAQSLCLETNSEYKLKLPSEKNIFAKKNDPFADDFFYSVPKKNGHLTKTEIPPEYV